MKPEYAVMEAAFNLLKAAEQNQTELHNLIQKLESSSSLLEAKTREMNYSVSKAIKESVQDASIEIANNITKNISKANEKANAAADRLDKASKKSFFIFSMLHILFTVMNVLVLWFIFIKDITTRATLIEMQNNADELEKYADVYNCNEKKCVEIVGVKTGMISPKTKGELYYLKPSR